MLKARFVATPPPYEYSFFRTPDSDTPENDTVVTIGTSYSATGTVLFLYPVPGQP